MGHGIHASPLWGYDITCKGDLALRFVRTYVSVTQDDLNVMTAIDFESRGFDPFLILGFGIPQAAQSADYTPIQYWTDVWYWYQNGSKYYQTETLGTEQQGEVAAVFSPGFVTGSTKVVYSLNLTDTIHSVQKAFMSKKNLIFASQIIVSGDARVKFVVRGAVGTQGDASFFTLAFNYFSPQEEKPNAFFDVTVPGTESRLRTATVARTPMENVAPNHAWYQFVIDSFDTRVVYVEWDTLVPPAWWDTHPWDYVIPPLVWAPFGAVVAYLVERIKSLKREKDQRRKSSLASEA
jgi:hypothetical protein